MKKFFTAAVTAALALSVVVPVLAQETEATPARENKRLENMPTRESLNDMGMKLLKEKQKKEREAATKARLEKATAANTTFKETQKKAQATREAALKAARETRKAAIKSAETNFQTAKAAADKAFVETMKAAEAARKAALPANTGATTTTTVQ